MEGPVLANCDWMGRELDLQLLSECSSMYNCLSRSVPEIFDICDYIIQANVDLVSCVKRGFDQKTMRLTVQP